MRKTLDTHDVAAELHVSIGLFIWRLRQIEARDELSFPQMSLLARLDRSGPSTPGELARAEWVSPQAVGQTLSVLELAGFIRRRADPADGRRVLMSLTPAGVKELRKRRSSRTEHLAEALAQDFTQAQLRVLKEAAPLIEMLADAVVPPASRAAARS